MILPGYCASPPCRLHASCTEDALSAAIAAFTTARQRQQRNGGLALPVLLDAREQLDERLDIECCEVEELVTIEMRDIIAALKMVPRE